jgi:YegS C-terminal NAD kinase beta sandwich-like domain
VSIEKGAPWGRPATGHTDLTVEGDDADLAGAVARHPGARVAFHPSADSDFARAVGLSDDAVTGGATTELPCDALAVEADGTTRTAVNMVVLGTPPDRERWWSPARRVLVRVDNRVVHDGRAIAVVIANGQHLRGNDVVPRGHPADGRAEVQVYSLARGQRAAMRGRLPLGTHIPHPRILSTSGRRVEVWPAEGMRPLEVDGHAVDPVAELAVTVLAGAFRLLL